jgi:hypothetical protein
MAENATLGAAGERLRAAVAERYELAPHEQVLLDSACHLADVIADLEAVVARDGVSTVTATGTPKVHPCVSEARQCRIALSRLLVDLSLPVDDADGEVKRESPGTLRARAAAKARHDRNLARIVRKGEGSGAAATTG